MASDRQSVEGRPAEEFTELYAACYRRLYLYIVTLIGNPLDAHDILQDANLVLWQKFDQFERGSNFFAWAREIARYRVLRYRQMHLNDAPTLEPHVLDALARQRDTTDDCRDQLYTDALPECVEKLREDDRELLQLRYAKGAAVQALAERLNRSANAISQSLGRIRRLLRKCVADAIHRKDVEEGLLG